MKKIASKQQGTVLIAGLMILLILTIMGIATMNSSTLAEKLSGNLRDKTNAFQSAESALLDAEQWLKQQPNRPSTTAACSLPPCDVWAYGIQQDLDRKSDSWWQSNAKAFSSTLYGSTSLPRYIIQEEMFIPYELSPESLSKRKGYEFYKITSKGTGSTSDSKVYIESVYSVSFN
ncbi:MAG: PilX N-terminal domain-containing pilus assembly protein [Gammaproteobacteria bacterium]